MSVDYYNISIEALLTDIYSICDSFSLLLFFLKAIVAHVLLLFYLQEP